MRKIQKKSLFQIKQIIVTMMMIVIITLTAIVQIKMLMLITTLHHLMDAANLMFKI